MPPGKINIMGLFDKKPIIPSKLESFKKPDAKPQRAPDPLKDDWFRGRSQIPKVEIEKYFKDPKVRYGLKRELGLPLNDERRLDQEINSMKKMMFNKFGTGAIDLAEAKRSIYEQSWNIRRQNKIPPKDPKEGKLKIIEQKKYEFLKKKFGIQ